MPINRPSPEHGPALGERLPRPEEVRKQQADDRADMRKKYDTWRFEKMRHEVQVPKPT